MSSFLIRTVAWSAVAIVLGVGVSLAWLNRDSLLGESDPHLDEHNGDYSAADSRVTIRAVKPRPNRGELIQEVNQPVYVQGLYTAALQARVAGTVKAVNKFIGDRVKMGEPLIVIHAPDLEQAAAQKQALVKLAEQQVKAMQAVLVAYQAAAKAAQATVQEKEATIDRAESRRKYTQAVYARIRKLAASNAVEPSLVDERLRELEAAEADLKMSQAALETAKANAEEAGARVQQAKVDVEVTLAKVAVARAEANQAETMLGFATLCAPFDGQVTMRSVDPGAFVQNASTGKSEPLMTVLRSDRVTLVMWVPEREAPFVAVGQEATIRLDALGGKEITAKVTRLSGWLNPDRARDMRVEVDLDNSKLGLRAGMYGTMRIVLRRFEDSTILPASAVFARGGKTLICQVEDGVVKMHRVRVLYEDGVYVSVAKLVKWRDPQTKLESDQEAPLLGTEVIVRSGQGELRDGQEVQVNLMEN